jgi:hypothetical protein
MLGKSPSYIVSSDIDLRQPEKLIAVWTGLDDFLQGQVHPGIAVDQVSVQRLAILEFDQHRLALSSGQQPQWELEDDTSVRS